MGAFVLWLAAGVVLVGLAVWLLARRDHTESSRDRAASFVERFRKAAEAGPGAVEVVGISRGGTEIVVRIDSQEMTLPLTEVFHLEQRFPANFSDTVALLVQELSDQLASPSDYLFDEALTFVMPQIRSRQWVRENSPAMGPGKVLTEDLTDELVACFVLDERDAIVFVTEGHLAAWGCGLQSIASFARSNLAKIVANERLALPGPGETEPKVLHLEDGYTAARLLVLLKDRAHELGGLVFAIPDRDTLVIARADSDLDRLAHEVRQEHEASHRPISPEIFRVRDGALVAHSSRTPVPVISAPGEP
jgi:uncharacterized protein YtpQ (UPF0354 family)